MAGRRSRRFVRLAGHSRLVSRFVVAAGKARLRLLVLQLLELRALEPGIALGTIEGLLGSPECAGRLVLAPAVSCWLASRSSFRAS